MKKRILLLSIALPALVIAFIIYQNINNKTTENNIAAISKNDVTMVKHHDFPVARNLAEMTNNSQFVVIGEYKSLDSKWNMLRDPNNAKLESKDGYVEGHLYNFEVSKVLKGDIKDNNILVNHKYLTREVYDENDEIINNEGVIVKEATTSQKYNFDNKDVLYIEPDLGNEYILFLNENSNLGNYYGSIEPFSIKLDKNNNAILQSNLIGGNTTNMQNFKTDKNNVTIINEFEENIIDVISGKSLNELITEITAQK